MWRGKDVLYNVLGYLVFGVPIKMHPIVYREPHWFGEGWGTARPLTPPPRAARLPDVRAAYESSWGVCCG